MLKELLSRLLFGAKRSRYYERRGLGYVVELLSLKEQKLSFRLHLINLYLRELVVIRARRMPFGIVRNILLGR